MSPHHRSPALRRLSAAAALAGLGAVGAASASLLATGPAARGATTVCLTAVGQTTTTLKIGGCSTTHTRTQAPATTHSGTVVHTTTSGEPGSTTSRVPRTTTKSAPPPTTTALAGVTTEPAAVTSTSPDVVVVTGHGYGHGMGLGQWGAYGYATHGWSVTRILEHYYRGTTVDRTRMPTVRILLADRVGAVSIGSGATWRVVDASGRAHRLPPGALDVTSTLALHGRALPFPLRFRGGTQPLTLGGVAYRGDLLVVSTGGHLQAVDILGMEQYLDGVVGAEMPASWPAAALEAQAIAARSYAVAKMTAVSTNRGYDLYDDTRSQSYGGVAAETAAVSRAVAATAGEVVHYHGAVATTYFSSSSGGRTASAQEGVGRSIPYLVPVRDPYDTLSPNHAWGPLLLDARDVAARLGLAGPLRRLSTVTGPSGRIVHATASGARGSRALTGVQLEQELGLRSTWFSVGRLALAATATSIPAGRSVTLTGTAVGVGRVLLEARTERAGEWHVIARIRPSPDGAFTAAVAPTTTTGYRLAAGTVRAGLVRIDVRGRASRHAGHRAQ